MSFPPSLVPLAPNPRAGFALRGVALALAVSGASVALAALGPARSVTWSGRTMGTYVNVTMVTADSAALAPTAVVAHAVFRRVDSLMSNWTTTSEVARLNRECGRAPQRVHPEVARVLDLALRVGAGSDGAFDVTVEPLVRAWGFLGGKPHVPTPEAAAEAFARVGLKQVAWDPEMGLLGFANDRVRVDLGGIAKGHAVDAAAESLRARGVRDALVDLTGNMFAMGRPASASGWRIGIRDPRDRAPHFARLRLSNEGISTSGKYEQFVAADGRTYGHIMDPRTGRPADGLISVTLVSASALTCDAWDTPLFVLGLDGAKRLAKAHEEFSAVLVVPGTRGVDTVYVESELADRFVLEPWARSNFRVVHF